MIPPAPASAGPGPQSAPAFDLFAILAEMRTGSNFLEAQIAALPGTAVHGEAFNPAFLGQPGGESLLGVDRARRDADPLALLAALRAAPGLNGFRLFGDHDPRAIEAVLLDPRCAKIVLTRNPAESYVSLKIAARTGQWRLTNPAHARSGAVRFDAEEFRAHLDRLQAFQLRILRALQTTGQTAFFVDYEDIQDLAVIQGLARWLGLPPPEALDRRLKKQNPEPLSDKVVNFAEMEAALGGALDRFDLSRTPNFEPRRGPAVPRMAAAFGLPLLTMPVPAGPEEALLAWLAALDPEGRVVEGFTHRTLARWKAARPGHRSVTILRHPLARAHAAFCTRVLAPDGAAPLREALVRLWGAAIPPEGVRLPGAGWPPGWDAAAHRAAFGAFLRFVRANLSGQTALRTDPAWASQIATLQGFAQIAPPDLVLREEEAPEALPALARRLGAADPPPFRDPDPLARRLSEIHDPALEQAAEEACARDHAAFGFGRWRPPG